MKTATHAILFLILIGIFASQSEAAEVYFEFGAYQKCAGCCLIFKIEVKK